MADGRRARTGVVALGALAIAFNVGLTVARAQECAGAAAGDRLDVITRALRDDAADARLWAWGWGAGLGALAVGQGALALTRSDRGERAELFVGAGKSVLGLAPVLFFPVPARKDAPVLDARLGAGGDRCAVLPDAALALDRSAADEAFSRNWLAHTLTVAVNAGGLLIVGYGYHRWTTGTAGAVVGTLVGELQIFTRPTRALRRRAASGESRAWTLAPLLSRDAVGVQLAGVWSAAPRGY